MRAGGVDLPDAIAVDGLRDGSVLRLRFSFDGKETVVIHLDQARSLALLSEVHGKIGSETLAPISRSLLERGQAIQVEATQAQRLPDGGLGLRLFALVDGRRVTIPCELSPDGVKELKQTLWAND